MTTAYLNEPIKPGDSTNIITWKTLWQRQEDAKKMIFWLTVAQTILFFMTATLILCLSNDIKILKKENEMRDEVIRQLTYKDINYEH